MSEKPKRNLSPETREKLSKAAKKRVAEGKMGGSEFGRLGGRPRKDRASTKVAEAAQKEAEDIIRVFRDGIKPGEAMTTRLRAAELWLNIEAKDAHLALQEEELDAKNMSRDELIKALAQVLTKGPTANALRRMLPQLEEEAGIVDAEVVDGDAA